MVEAMKQFSARKPKIILLLNGVFSPESVEYTPDENGNPPVCRAALPGFHQEYTPDENGNPPVPGERDFPEHVLVKCVSTKALP